MLGRLTSFLGPFGKGADLASYLQTIMWAANALKGGAMPESAPAAAKALRDGFFGNGDEVAIQRAVLEMTDDEPEYIWGLLDYGYIRPAKSGMVGRFWAGMVLSKWRTIVANMDQPGQKSGVSEAVTTTLNPDGSKTITTVKTDVVADYTKLSLRFLRDIVETIKAEEKKQEELNVNRTDGEKLSPEQCREEGYKIVLARFEAAGIPRMPSPETLAEIDNLFRNTKSWVIRIFEEGKLGLVDYINSAHANLEDRRQAEIDAIWGDVPDDKRTFWKRPIHTIRVWIKKLEQHS